VKAGKRKANGARQNGKNPLGEVLKGSSATSKKKKTTAVQKGPVGGTAAEAAARGKATNQTKRKKKKSPQAVLLEKCKQLTQATDQVCTTSSGRKK